jgi:transposase
MSAPEQLRAELRACSTSIQVTYCAALRDRPARSLEYHMTIRALRCTAGRIQQLAAEATGLEGEIGRLVAAIAPWLLELPGMGPSSGARVLVSWSHAGRLGSEGAFAALAGVSLIPASSGQVTRHRLNRGGDRRLNRARARSAAASSGPSHDNCSSSCSGWTASTLRSSSDRAECGWMGSSWDQRCS